MKSNTDTLRPLPHRLSWLEVGIRPGHCCLRCNTEFKSHDVIETDDGFVLDCRSCGTRFLEVAIVR
jgi:hypothetical protein